MWSDQATHVLLSVPHGIQAVMLEVHLRGIDPKDLPALQEVLLLKVVHKVFSLI